VPQRSTGDAIYLSIALIAAASRRVPLILNTRHVTRHRRLLKLAKPRKTLAAHAVKSQCDREQAEDLAEPVRKATGVGTGSQLLSRDSLI
jgi:hypothetical protein